MVEQIKDYLKSKNPEYMHGLVLLSKVCKNRILITHLGRKQKKEKLLYELGKYLKREIQINENINLRPATIGQIQEKANDSKVNQNIDPKEKVQDSEKIKSKFRVEIERVDAKLKYVDMPDELKLLWDKNTDDYKASRSLHEKLKLMEKSTDQEREPFVSQLTKLSVSIRKNWDTIDDYFDPEKQNQKANPIPYEKLPIEINHKRISANRKFISVNLPKFELDKENFILKAKIQIRISELLKVKESFGGNQSKKLIELGFEVGLKE